MNSTANTSNKANSKTNKAIKAKSAKETVPERNSPRLHKSPPGMKSSDRVLAEPIRDQIERRFTRSDSVSEVAPDSTDFPQSNQPEASVIEPTVSQGSGVINEPAAITSLDPNIVSVSGANVPLAVTGAPVPNTVALSRVPSSLQTLVDKYCVATCEIPIERIVPGNNPRLLMHSGVERIKGAIQNSGWDTNSIFIVQLVSEDPRFFNAEEVRKDEQLLKFVVEEGQMALVNGHHREKAVLDLKAVHFTLFPLPQKFLCKICVGISKWDHFLISKKANFVSSAAVEDCLYDKVHALDFAIQQFKMLYPTETPTEKRIKLFYEEEVGAKSTSVGTFNMYFNLSKTLTDEAKELLKIRTGDADHEFTTTDAMKTIVSVSKNVFKNKPALLNQYQQHCINCMYRFFIAHGEKRLSSVTFTTLSSYIAMHVEFRQTCIYKIAEELELEVEKVVLPPAVVDWFFQYLDNFDTANSALEACVEIVKDNAGLVQANPAYLPYELRQILTRAISAAKSAKSNKADAKKGVKRHAEQSEENTISRSGTPVKHRTKKQSNVKAVARDVLPEVQEDDGGQTETDPECIEEEIEDDQVQVHENEYEAVQDLFDPQTPYRCPSSETLQKARAFWIGPHNCQVNTPETDAVAKAKTEWIQVHSSPLNPKDTDGLKPGAFVCLDIRESDDYNGCTFLELIKVVPPLLLRGGCFIILGNNQQLASIDVFLQTQVDLKLRSDGETFYNYFIYNVKNDGRHSKQNLVQPYLLAFKQLVPSYNKVPSKDEPFSSAFFANQHIKQNTYPESCDVINNVDQQDKLSSTYQCEKTGRGVFGFSGIPVGVYSEIFRRYGGDFAGETVYDLSPERSKIGEAALSNLFKYVAFARNAADQSLFCANLNHFFDITRSHGTMLPYGIPCSQLLTTHTNTYQAEEIETLFAIFHGRPAMPIEVDRLQCFLAHNEQQLLAQCERTGVITGASNIVHSGAGLGLFAARDFKKGEVIGHYFGALYLCHKDSTPTFFGYPERAIEYKAQPFYRFSHVTVYLVGSKNCPTSYINEVRHDTVFDTSNPDVLHTLIKHAPDFQTNPLSAINSYFEEMFDPTYNVTEGCWGNLDQAVCYYAYSNITIHAARDVNNGEEILISYEKPEPCLLDL